MNRRVEPKVLTGNSASSGDAKGGGVLKSGYCAGMKGVTFTFKSNNLIKGISNVKESCETYDMKKLSDAYPLDKQTIENEGELYRRTKPRTRYLELPNDDFPTLVLQDDSSKLEETSKNNEPFIQTESPVDLRKIESDHKEVTKRKIKILNIGPNDIVNVPKGLSEIEKMHDIGSNEIVRILNFNLDNKFTKSQLDQNVFSGKTSDVGVDENVQKEKLTNFASQKGIAEIKSNEVTAEKSSFEFVSTDIKKNLNDENINNSENIGKTEVSEKKIEDTEKKETSEKKEMPITKDIKTIFERFRLQIERNKEKNTTTSCMSEKCIKNNHRDQIPKVKFATKSCEKFKCTDMESEDSFKTTVNTFMGSREENTFCDDEKATNRYPRRTMMDINDFEIDRIQITRELCDKLGKLSGKNQTKDSSYKKCRIIKSTPLANCKVPKERKRKSKNDVCKKGSASTIKSVSDTNEVSIKDCKIQRKYSQPSQMETFLFNMRKPDKPIKASTRSSSLELSTDSSEKVILAKSIKAKVDQSSEKVTTYTDIASLSDYYNEDSDQSDSTKLTLNNEVTLLARLKKIKDRRERAKKRKEQCTVKSEKNMSVEVSKIKSKDKSLQVNMAPRKSICLQNSSHLKSPSDNNHRLHIASIIEAPKGHGNRAENPKPPNVSQRPSTHGKSPSPITKVYYAKAQREVESHSSSQFKLNSFPSFSSNSADNFFYNDDHSTSYQFSRSSSHKEIPRDYLNINDFYHSGKHKVYDFSNNGNTTSPITHSENNGKFENHLFKDIGINLESVPPTGRNRSPIDSKLYKKNNESDFLNENYLDYLSGTLSNVIKRISKMTQNESPYSTKSGPSLPTKPDINNNMYKNTFVTGDKKVSSMSDDRESNKYSTILKNMDESYFIKDPKATLNYIADPHTFKENNFESRWGKNKCTDYNRLGNNSQDYCNTNHFQEHTCGCKCQEYNNGNTFQECNNNKDKFTDFRGGNKFSDFNSTGNKFQDFSNIRCKFQDFSNNGCKFSDWNTYSQEPRANTDDQNVNMENSDKIIKGWIHDSIFPIITPNNSSPVFDHSSSPASSRFNPVDYFPSGYAYPTMPARPTPRIADAKVEWSYNNGNNRKIIEDNRMKKQNFTEFNTICEKIHEKRETKRLPVPTSYIQQKFSPPLKPKQKKQLIQTTEFNNKIIPQKQNTRDSYCKATSNPLEGLDSRISPCKRKHSKTQNFGSNVITTLKSLCTDGYG